MKAFKWLSVLVFLGCLGLFVSFNIQLKGKQDTKKPVISIDGELIEISVDEGDEALLKGVTATDDVDGDVTDSLVVESISDFTDDMYRYVKYAAFDSSNNVVKATRKMKYTDYEPIHFSLDGPMRISTGNRTQDLLVNIHASDSIDGDLTDQIVYLQDSSTSTTPTSDYEVELQVSNSAGYTATLPLTVNVYNWDEDQALPKILLSDYLVYTKVGTEIDPYDYLTAVRYGGVDYAVTEGRGTFRVDTSGMSAEELEQFNEEQRNSPGVNYGLFSVKENIDYQTPGVYTMEYAVEGDNYRLGKVNLIVVVEGR